MTGMILRVILWRILHCIILYIITVAAETPRKCNIIFNVAENFDAHHPDGEKSQIFSKLTA